MNEVQNQTELNFVGQELTEQEKTVIRLIHAEQKVFEIEKEIKRLQAMKKQIDAEIEADKESLEPFIGHIIKGFKVGMRFGHSLVMRDGAIIPDEFKRVKVEPDKVAMKAAIIAGRSFEGFEIESKIHVNLSCLI
jgi:hypothetical protein